MWTPSQPCLGMTDSAVASGAWGVPSAAVRRPAPGARASPAVSSGEESDSGHIGTSVLGWRRARSGYGFPDGEAAYRPWRASNGPQTARMTRVVVIEDEPVSRTPSSSAPKVWVDRRPTRVTGWR